MGNALKKINKLSCYKMPDQLTTCTGLWSCNENGIFFDKKQYSRMFVLSRKSESISFEEYFVLLRMNSVHYQIRRDFPDGITYLTLYVDSSKVKSFEEAGEYFQDIVSRLGKVSAAAEERVAFMPLDTNGRFQLMCRLVLFGTTSHVEDLGDLPQDYLQTAARKWIHSFVMQHIDFSSDSGHFIVNGRYCRLYMVVRGSEQMYDCLEKQKGVAFITSEMAGIPDHVVVNRMKSLYLDAEQIVSKLMKKDPELYDLYINGAKRDSMSYTIAGALILLSDEIEENLKEYSRELELAAVENEFEIAHIYGEHQKELLKLLYPVSMRCLPTRVNRTETAVDFCKYI